VGVINLATLAHAVAEGSDGENWLTSWPGLIFPMFIPARRLLWRWSGWGQTSLTFYRW
jgi:hypothetical protein